MTIRAALFIVLLVAYSLQTHRYARVFQSDLDLWGQAVRMAPLKSRPWINYGLALARIGAFDAAAAAFRSARIVADLPHVPAWDRREAIEASERNLRVLTLAQLMREVK